MTSIRYVKNKFCTKFIKYIENHHYPTIGGNFLVKIKHDKIKQKNFTRIFFRMSLIFILISACIQIMPFEVKIIENISASSIWLDTNWSAPNNYTDSCQVETIKDSGDLRLYYGPGIFVADTLHHQIVLTNMYGTIWTVLGSQGTGKGQFNGPADISYDSNTGFVYVSEWSNHRIVKTKMDGTGWTTFGSQGSGIGQFYDPSAIHYDSSTGYIYVADTHNHRIIKTMMNGSGWTTYGSEGYGIGQFREPFGIWYDNNSGFIYIADYSNHRIVKTKIDGTGWTTYGTSGTGKGQFNHPIAICYDNTTGYIYVADFYNHRIVQTKINGSGWTTYGSEGNGTGQFDYPEGIEYNSNTGYVYVADLLNHRIIKTMMDGSGWTSYGSYCVVPNQGKFRHPWGVTLCDSCYGSSGYLPSRIYDCGCPANFQTISWVGDTPTNTSIKFQLKSANNESNMATKDFIGPDGTNNTYYTTSGDAIWPGHNGNRWIQYRVNLSSTDILKTPILKDVGIKFNILPNRPILIAPENNSCTNNNVPLFIWLFNDTDSNPQSAFQWQMDDLINFSSIDYDSNQILTAATSFTPDSSISDGTWYWRVRARDSDNDWGPYSLPWKIMIDTIAPTSEIICPSNNKFYNNIGSISGQTSDSAKGSGVEKVELIIHRITDDSFWNGTSWIKAESWLQVSGNSKWNYNSSLIPWTSGMEYQIRSRSTDNASNIEIPSEGNKFIYDAEEVIYSKVYPLAEEILNTTEVEVGITISDIISGVNVSTIEYSISNNSGISWDLWKSIEGYISGKIVDIKLNLTFPNGTGNKIRWRASDIAGNGPAYSDEYVINVNIPKPSIFPEIKLLSPANNSKITTTKIEFSWEVVKNYHPYILFDIKMDTTNPPQNIVVQNYTGTKLIIDELENGQTYYWTVIPKLGSMYGICISDIWSFNVDIPLPRVTLLSPANGSIIQAKKPRLTWALEYTGTSMVKYDVYFGKEKDPVIYQNNITINYFSIDFSLDDNTTYYWKVEPWAGDYPGPSSETWSFTIKQQYIPHFELELFVSPPLVELTPRDIKRVRAIVRNLGELEDSILLRVEVPPDLGVGAMVDEPCIVNAIPNATAEFYITVTTSMNPQKDEINLMVVAVSRRATEYELTVEEKAELTVKILTQEKKDDDEPWLSLSEFWIIFLIIIIILIVMIIVWTFLRHKKRDQETQEESTAEDALTVKPGTVPKAVISVGEAAQTVTQPQLSETTADVTLEHQIQAPVKVPTLAASTTPGQVPVTQHIPSTTEVPQLPAAQPKEPSLDQETQETSTIEISADSQTEIKEQPPRTTQMQPKEQPNIED